MRIAVAALATLSTIVVTVAAQPKGAVTVAADGRVVIDAPPCAALVAGAAYVPGIDVEGHAVVPADLADAKPAMPPETAAIEIDARLAARFGVKSSGAGVGRTILGYVTVREGRAYFNGAPLVPEANDAVVSACKAPH